MKFWKKVASFFKSGNFITGAAILAIAGLICRFIGVIFRIPLTNIVGHFGMGLYQMVFPLYSLLLIVSSAGVPVAISKMVAKEKVNGNLKESKQILFNAIILLGVIGAVVSALFMVFAFPIAQVQGNKEAGIIYLAIAPSVFLVCIIAAFRGYFQGLQNMVPTASSQIIEQIVKVAVGVTLAVVLNKISVIWAVFGAILAVTISEVVALVILIATYFFTERKNKNKEPKTNLKAKIKSKLNFKLMWSILKQSAPITLMASIFPLILVFDSMVVVNMLTSTGQNYETATQLYGISSGAVHALINLPAVLSVAVATAVVPTVSSLMKQNKVDELRSKCALAVKITFLIAFFFAAFFMAFSDKILDLLFHNAFLENPEHLVTASKLMKIESVLIILMGISSVFTAILQGANRSKFPLIALAIGGAAKVIFELAFIKSDMGIYAVSIGNVLCFALSGTICTIFALKLVKIKKGLGKHLLKALALATIFAVTVYAIFRIMPENRWWVLLSGAIAVAIYVILVAIFRFLRLNELGVGNISNNPNKEENHEKN